MYCCLCWLPSLSRLLVTLPNLGIPSLANCFQGLVEITACGDFPGLLWLVRCFTCLDRHIYPAVVVWVAVCRFASFSASECRSGVQGSAPCQLLVVRPTHMLMFNLSSLLGRERIESHLRVEPAAPAWGGTQGRAPLL